MHVCFTSDLHGRESLYSQLSALLRAERPDLLLLGGDMLREADPRDVLGTQVAWVHSKLRPLIEEWRATLPGLRIGTIVGNHDLTAGREAIRALDARGLLRLLEPHTPWQVEGVNVLGYGHSPPTPFWVKDFERLDLRGAAIPADFGGGIWQASLDDVVHISAKAHFGAQPAMEDELESLPTPPQPWFFVCHCPPHETPIDHSALHIRHLGSRAVRKFIEARQPLLSLHGHIHEAPRMSGVYRHRMGATLAINPGQEHDALHAVLFDSRDVHGTLRHTVYP